MDESTEQTTTERSSRVSNGAEAPHLGQMAEHALGLATAAANGRHAEVLVHDGPLRQSVIALRKGTELAEHNAPPAASLQMLSGSVRITGTEPAEIAEGALQVLTHERHGVRALADSVFLLTTVTGVPGSSSHGEAAET